MSHGATWSCGCWGWGDDRAVKQNRSSGCRMPSWIGLPQVRGGVRFDPLGRSPCGSGTSNVRAWKIGSLGPSSPRSEEHTSELQSLMRNSYAVFCLKKKNKIKNIKLFCKFIYNI